jgi:hypothetical protein
MRTALLAAAFLISTAFAAEADVRVRVEDDVRGAGSIARYLEHLGERYLSPSQKLDITILEYRRSRGGLSGDPFYRPYGFHRGFGYGFGHGYWRDPFYGSGRPGHLTLQYSLRERGKVVASDIETITSWNDRFGYGFGSGFSNDRSEVRRWFRKTFGTKEREES